LFYSPNKIDEKDMLHEMEVFFLGRRSEGDWNCC
jgi:hypothetical protein